MSTSIKEIEKSQKANRPKVESEKVSKFLKLRYKLRKTKDAASTQLDTMLTKMDPRANHEDYLRRAQRLDELVKATRNDPTVSADPDVIAKLTSAETTLTSTKATVDAAQSKNQRPDFGGQRDLLKDSSDKLQGAIAAAVKRGEKREEDNPAIVDRLERLDGLLNDAGTKATSKQMDTWRAQHATIAKSFYGPKPDTKKLFAALEGLIGTVGQVVVENGRQAKAIREKSIEITAVMARSTLPVDQLAPIDGLLKRAAREASGLDYRAATATLAAAQQLLPQGVPPATPTIADVEQRRVTLHKAAEASLVKAKPGAKANPALVSSEPARARVVALLHQLDGLRPLCQQTDEVAVEALRRVEACEAEFRTIKAADGDAAGFAKEKEQTWKPFIAGKIDELTKAFAKAPQDGGMVKLQLRLAALASSFAAEWPKLMTMQDIEASGLLREATAIDEEYDEWKEQRQAQPMGGAKDWQREFYDAVTALKQVTEKVMQSDVGLMKTLGLATKMPALIAKGGSLITGADPGAAEQEVRKITRELLDTVGVARTRLEHAPSLDAIVAEGDKLAAAYGQRIEAGLGDLEKLQPGSKMAKLKKVGKFFKESAFADDDERAVRIDYGGTLKDKLEGLTNILRCKDPTAAQGALADLKELEWQVRDFEAMAQNAKPGQKDGSAPPPFAELQKRIKEIQKKIAENTKDSDLGTRVDTLKGWSERAGALSDQVGEADPRALEQEIGALEREILQTTADDKAEIGRANGQINKITETLLRVMDARKKGSPLQTAFGPLLAELQRQGEAMRKSVQQWKVTDAGFDAWQKEVVSALNTRRPAAETDALTTKSGKAAEDDKAVEAARKALLKLRDSDLRLWREKADGFDKDQKAMMVKLLDDLDKEAERGLEALAENRDADGAQALVKSVLREVQEAALGKGDKITSRGELDKLDTNWRQATAALRRTLETLANTVKDAAKGAAADVIAAADALEKQTVVPVLAIFDPALFTGSIKAMSSDDAKVRATNREAALGEIRRIRRVMESDNRVRLLLANEFGVIVPLPEISSRLFDIEVNVTRARGA